MKRRRRSARRRAAFRQFEITKSSAASCSAAHTTEIESHRLSPLWIMNPAPQPAADITPVGCGAEANASCNCGVSYVAKSVRAAEAIKANPKKSDRAIAAEIGVSVTTVGQARKASGVNFLTPERVGQDGKSYSIRQRIRGKPGRLPHRGRPEEVPSLCVNYDTSRCRESTYFASVSSLTGTRRQWRVLFEKRRSFSSRCRKGTIKAGSNEDRPCGRWPAIYCPRAFLVRTSGGVTLRTSQCWLIDVGARVAALGVGLGWFALCYEGGPRPSNSALSFRLSSRRPSMSLWVLSM
jgi:hypothetical protein